MILSGDNALVIGMAAAGLAPDLRKRAIMLGMALAAGLSVCGRWHIPSRNQESFADWWAAAAELGLLAFLHRSAGV